MEVIVVVVVVVVVVAFHMQRFGYKPKKLLVANPARGLLNRKKRTEQKVWQRNPPPTPHAPSTEEI